MSTAKEQIARFAAEIQIARETFINVLTEAKNEFERSTGTVITSIDITIIELTTTSSDTGVRVETTDSSFITDCRIKTNISDMF